MSNKNLHISDNLFDISTKLDHKLMNNICIYHLEKLNNSCDDYDLRLLYKHLLSAYNIFANRCVNYIVSDFSLKFEEKIILGYFDDLSAVKIHVWNKKIQKHFPENSLIYNSIFPEGISPYFSENNSHKVDLIKNLADKLNSYPGISSLRKDINNFYCLVKKSFDNIENKHKILQDEFDLVEKARIKVANILYRNYCFLSNKYDKSPEKIFAYFNIDMFNDSKDFTSTSGSDLSSLWNLNKLSDYIN